MAALVDTNVLVYVHDARFPEKRRIARELISRGIATDSLRVAHQALVEFVAATTRPIQGGPSLLTLEESRREAEELLHVHTVLYPTEALFRIAIRGWATYGLSWFDAHMWAYAEHYGLSSLISEDFQHDRLYGTVRAINPFTPDGFVGVREPWAEYRPIARETKRPSASRIIKRR